MGVASKGDTPLRQHHLGVLALACSDGCVRILKYVSTSIQLLSTLNLASLLYVLGVGEFQVEYFSP